MMILSLAHSQTLEDYSKSIKNTKGAASGFIKSKKSTTFKQASSNKDNILALMLLGMAFEFNNGKGKKGGGALKGLDWYSAVLNCSKRKGLFHKTASIMAGVPSQKFTTMVNKLSKSNKSYLVKLALTAIAIRGVMDPDDGNSGNYEDAIKIGLNKKDLVIKELALASAGYFKLANLKDAIEAIAPSKNAAVEGARLFSLARLGAEIEDDVFKESFKLKNKTSSQFSNVSGKLSNYNPQLSGAAYTCYAAGILKKKYLLPEIYAVLKSKRDIRSKIEATNAIKEIGENSSIPELIKTMNRCSWPVLVWTCQAIGEIPDKQSIEPLIKRLKREKGRFRLDIIYALSSIAGGMKGETAKHWEAWWRKNKETFKVNVNKTKEFRSKRRVQDMIVPSNGMFYSMSIFSDRVVFVVDTSKSMTGDKIQSLKDELTITLKDLKRHVYFNVVGFGGKIHKFANYLVQAKQKAAAIEYVKYMELSYGTRSFDSMELGMIFNEADTIYFLSDGAPFGGYSETWKTIINSYKCFNRYRPMAIFTLDFSAGQKNATQMKILADENWGLTESIK